MDQDRWIKLILADPVAALLTEREYLYIDPEHQRKMVENDQTLIRFINKPTIEVQKFVVQKNPSFIKYIRNPAASVKTLAVQKDKEAIWKIKNPGKRLVLMALNKEAAEMVRDPEYDLKEE